MKKPYSGLCCHINNFKIKMCVKYHALLILVVRAVNFVSFKFLDNTFLENNCINGKFHGIINHGIFYNLLIIFPAFKKVLLEIT
ncbi:hypothetical protein SDC9_193774 [bioreactor metagenome]|uniref:Uncharacterized protein n=1 Tax=bioreactor metagenome TaxID=1076179 RepID=A0A645I4H2_9ZZZZ